MDQTSATLIARYATLFVILSVNSLFLFSFVHFLIDYVGKIEKGSTSGAEESFKSTMAEARTLLLNTRAIPSTRSSHPPETKASSSVSAVPTTETFEDPGENATETHTPIAVSGTTMETVQPSTRDTMIRVDTKTAYAILAALLLSVLANLLLTFSRV